MPTVLTRLFAHLCRAVLTLAGSQIAAAQEPARLQEQVQLCAACHGENGVPLEKDDADHLGPDLGYQYLQLRDYKNGDRKSDQMTPVVEMLEKSDLLALAEYFSKKPWPRNAAPSAPREVAEQAARANYGGRLYRLPSRPISRRGHATPAGRAERGLYGQDHAGNPQRRAGQQSRHDNPDEGHLARRS